MEPRTRDEGNRLSRTSGTKDNPPGSLLEQCTGKAVGVDAFDGTGRLGLIHMAYPLKMLLQADGHLISTDILHTVAGAIIFAIYENQDVCLVSLQIPEKVLRTFPGPAHGPHGLHALTKFGASVASWRRSDASRTSVAAGRYLRAAPLRRIARDFGERPCGDGSRRDWCDVAAEEGAAFQQRVSFPEEACLA